MNLAERLSGRTPSAADIDAIARRTLERLPPPFAESLGDVVLRIEEVTDQETARRLGLNHPMQLSGLYEGVSLNRQSVSQSGTLPERITLYRRPILAEWHATLALDRELPLKRALSFWATSVDEALDALAIAHLAAVPVRLLSSGQQKRAALARVAASGALLWLLDEPLNALDVEGADRLARLVEPHLDAGGAVVAASHQPLPGKWRRLELEP